VSEEVVIVRSLNDTEAMVSDPKKKKQKKSK
jgi:hypothetical protein